MDNNHHEYQRMIHKLNNGIFDAVLSVSLVRATWDDTETPKFMSLLRQEDIFFVTNIEKIYDLEIQGNSIYSEIHCIR